MKKILACIAVLAVTLALGVPADSDAKTFRLQKSMKVMVDGNGLVTLSFESPSDVDHVRKLIQFCPDRTKKGCGNNIVIMAKSTGNCCQVTFQLDLKAAEEFGQNAFNFKWVNDWLAIPDPIVERGPGIIYELSAPSGDSEDGKGGHHFTWKAVEERWD